MNTAKARRSQLLSTYGVGGLFPSEATSFMIAGIHEWDVERAERVPEAIPEDPAVRPAETLKTDDVFRVHHSRRLGDHHHGVFLVDEGERDRQATQR